MLIRFTPSQEIFFNPGDLNLMLTQQRDQDGDGPNITYGFIITRGRWGGFKRLIEQKPTLSSLEEALELMFRYLTHTIDTLTFPGAKPGQVLTKHIFGSTRQTLLTRRLVSTWIASAVAA